MALKMASLTTGSAGVPGLESAGAERQAIGQFVQHDLHRRIDLVDQRAEQDGCSPRLHGAAHFVGQTDGQQLIGEAPRQRATARGNAANACVFSRASGTATLSQVLRSPRRQDNAVSEEL